jgi:hypothetical protein
VLEDVKPGEWRSFEICPPLDGCPLPESISRQVEKINASYADFTLRAVQHAGGGTFNRAPLEWPFARLQALISFYAPSLAADLARLMAEVERHGAASVEWVAAGGDPAKLGPALGKLAVVQQRISTEARSITQAAAKIAQSLVDARA